VTTGQGTPFFGSVRVLVVDDFPRWRSLVSEILAVQAQWTVISEACNCQEAVQQASELQPDIIVLDIGLPGMDGIQAAKIIRKRSPKSRIVFLTQNNDSDVIEAALAVGRARVVLKANAATELCEAMAASLRES
jgi:DNA-binding NarL/FixJ family response regulator